MINKDTQICISISREPSNFGTTLHNLAYQALNLNFIYKACRVTNLVSAIDGVRALGIRGCSVSMPFKQVVIPLLDDLDDSAQSTGAVNTIVNKAGHLTGFNTDLVAARLALASLNLQSDEQILILGAGGIARAILVALRELGYKKVIVANRDKSKIKSLSEIMPCGIVDWGMRELDSVAVLINATSVGMTPDSQSMPVSSSFIKGLRAVIDVVVSPMETRLISCAREAGKLVISGYEISLEQAAAQFTLYTGHPAPREVMMGGISKLLKM
jgi:shikimate dehydrogenase